MEHGRTGRRYRLLFPVMGTGRGFAIVVYGFVILCALIVFTAATVTTFEALRDVASPTSVLHRLRRAPTDFERAAGRNWGVGTFRTHDGGPICYTEHQHYVSGKNGGWRTDRSVWLGASPVLEIGGYTWYVSPSELDFDPFDPEPVGDESFVRARVDYEPGGRIRAQCLNAGQAVFVDVCVTPGTARVGRCPNGDASTVTLGDGTATARIRSHASITAGFMAFGLLVVSLVLLCVWRALRAGGLVESIGRWSASPPPAARIPAYVLVGLAVFVSWFVSLAFYKNRSAVPYSVGGYAFGTTVVGAVVAALITAHTRRKKLQRAIDLVARAETSRLAEVPNGVAELVVRVRNDAATVSLPDHAPHAFVRVRIDIMRRHYRKVQLEHLRTAAWPAEVPVEDDSGKGTLKAVDADLDTRAVFRSLRGKDAHAYIRALATTSFGSLTYLCDDPNLAIEVEECYLDRGETLYLLSNVRRIKDPNTPHTYRHTGTLPVISTKDRALCLFAGNETSLLRTLMRERRLITSSSVTLAVLSAAYLATLVWLWKLA